MFDLEREIRRWRRSMTRRLPLRRDAVREIESHLRDAVSESTAKGAPPADAWKAALLLLGTPDSIADEYDKLPANLVWRWRPAQVLFGGFAVFVALLAWFLGSRIAAKPGDALLAIHVFSVTVGYVAVFTVGAVAAWSILSRALSGWSQIETSVLLSTMRFATGAGLLVTALGVVLGCVWAHDHLGRYWNWHPREIGAAALLAWNGLVLGLLIGRSDKYRGERRDERLGLLLGLAGVAVVASCWFVPAIVPPGALHDYARVTAATVVHVLTAALLIIALVALATLPPGSLRRTEA